MSAVLLVCATLLFGSCWVEYARLPFNSEGRYFDATEDVVYHEQSIGLWAVGTVLCAATAAAALLVARRLDRRRR